MNQNRIKIILSVASGVALVAAIVLFVLSLTVIENILTKIFMIIDSVLFLSL